MTSQQPRHTDLLVVRHGRTAMNIDERYLGLLDPPLDAHGFGQAAVLANALCGQASVIVSSPRLRAVQTAEVLATAWGLQVRPLDMFAERNVGVFEGLTQEEARAWYPVLWEQNITRRWNAAPPGGETIEAVFLRVRQGLDLLIRDYSGQAVVLVAHGFVAKVIRAIVFDLSWVDFFAYAMKNGDVERYCLDEAALSCWTGSDHRFVQGPGNESSGAFR